MPVNLKLNLKMNEQNSPSPQNSASRAGARGTGWEEALHHCFPSKPRRRKSLSELFACANAAREAGQIYHGLRPLTAPGCDQLRSGPSAAGQRR